MDSREPFEQPASIVRYLGEAQANNQLTLLATERSPFSPSHYIGSHVHGRSLDMTTLINHRSSAVPIADLFSTQTHHSACVEDVGVDTTSINLSAFTVAIFVCSYS